MQPKDVWVIAGARLRSQAQPGVTEEGEAERSIRADAVKASFGDVSDLLNRVGAKIGEFLRTSGCPHVLDGVEVWRVAWQSLDRGPVTMAGDPVVHAMLTRIWSDELHLCGWLVGGQRHRSRLI